MKTHLGQLALLAVVGSAGLPGCSQSDAVSKGIIFSVTYQRSDGGTEGFTRVNNSKAVPGGNGSWNIDAYGRLTDSFLFVTRPQRPELGTEVIPVSRLLNIRFGDGGIKQVNEGRPNPGT